MQKLKFVDSIVKMPLMLLPVRTVLVQIKENWVMISPGSKMRYEEIQSLNVTDIIAPNLFHNAGIKKAKEHFNKAKLWGVRGSSQKESSIKWDATLIKDVWPYSEDLVPVFIAGMEKVNEVVFYHPLSKSLIVTDLCFNLTKASGFGAWFILSLFGTYKKFGVSKFFIRAIRDRGSFETSMNAVMALDFENIIVSHGENLIGHGKAALRQALAERGLYCAPGQK